MVWILDGTGEEAKPTLTYLLDRIMENAPPDDSPNADCRSDPDDMQYAWYDSAIMAVGKEGIEDFWDKKLPKPPQQKYFCLDRSSDGLSITVASALKVTGDPWYANLEDLTGGSFPSLAEGKGKTYRLQPKESVAPSTEVSFASFFSSQSILNCWGTIGPISRGFAIDVHHNHSY